MTYFIRSAYFKTALNTDVGPPGDNSKTLEVTEFSYEVLSAAVDFMYGIEIPEDFNNRDDFKSLLLMADLYLMEDLKDLAGSLIAKDLNTENIFDTSQLADKFRAVTLADQCAKFLYDNHRAIADEKMAEMKEGTVMVALAKKFALESKRDSWVTELFGEKPDFKRRENFGSDEDYKSYVMSRIKPKMFVRCNKSSAWSGYNVKEGHVGFVKETYSTESVSVKWLTLKSGDPAYPLIKQPYCCGPFECLDLLTSPVSFNCS